MESKKRPEELEDNEELTVTVYNTGATTDQVVSIINNTGNIPDHQSTSSSSVSKKNNKKTIILIV